MTGYTPNYQLPYPDDYQQPADTPAVMQALATASDTALTGQGTRIAALERLVAQGGTYEQGLTGVPEAGAVIIAFPRPFASVPESITVTSGANVAAHGWNQAGYRYVVVKDYTTATQLGLRVIDKDNNVLPNGTVVRFHWIAVGELA